MQSNKILGLILGCITLIPVIADAQPITVVCEFGESTCIPAKSDCEALNEFTVTFDAGEKSMMLENRGQEIALNFLMEGPDTMAFTIARGGDETMMLTFAPKLGLLAFQGSRIRGDAFENIVAVASCPVGGDQ